MDRPGYNRIGRFFLPLAASGLLMTLQQPVVTAGIAHTTDAETALAAYGVAINIAVLLESPVQMLLPAANALTQNRQSYRLLRRFTLSIGLTLSSLLLLVASSPLGTLTVSRLIGAPPAVVQQVLITLLVMALWPLVVGWRRFYQGLLIRLGHTQTVGYATACRLLTIAVVVILAVNGSNWPGALVGGLALMAGAVIKAVFVTVRALPVIKAGWQNKGDELMLIANKENERIETSPPPHFPGNNQKQQPALAALVRFYIPLATTSVLTIVTWPLITAGISHATETTTSLAAWLVALSILWLLTTPIQMLQQVAITLIQSARSLHAVVRFGLAVGLLGSLLLASFAFTPLINLFLQYISWLRRPGLRLSSSLPLASWSHCPLSWPARACCRGC